MLNLGGTWRETTAEQTLGRITPMLWTQFGISRVADITGLDSLGIHTVISIRPNGKALSNSQGKGLSLELAKVSALMESIELWHGENLPAADLFGSYHELKREYPVFSPDKLQSVLFSPQMNNLPMPWVKVINLLSQTAAFLPQIHFNQNRAEFGNYFELFWPTSNGLASGNTLEEALCHALFELIERDCIQQSNLELLNQRQLDLAHLPSPLCETIIERILSQSIDLKIYDIRTTLEIPCYYATLGDAKTLRYVGLFAGYGCHFSDEIALLRAVTEAAQSRLTYISGARDDIVSSFYQKPWSASDQSITANHRPTFADLQSQSMQQCLQQLIHRLYSHGHQHIFYYDMTRAEIGIPVVHAVVPSLHFNQANHLFKIDNPL